MTKEELLAFLEFAKKHHDAELTTSDLEESKGGNWYTAHSSVMWNIDTIWNDYEQQRREKVMFTSGRQSLDRSIDDLEREIRVREHLFNIGVQETFLDLIKLIREVVDAAALRD